MDSVKSIYTFNNIEKEIVSKGAHLLEISKTNYVLVQFILITKPRFWPGCSDN